MNKKLNRIVIWGSNGFIAKNLKINLKKLNMNFISISKKKINLEKKQSFKLLSKIIKKNDIVLFIAAIAPVKTIDMLNNNIKICSNVCKALEKKEISSLIYISSDAVYSDSLKKIKETNLTLPSSLHGLMHLSREIILRDKFKKILTILRPTLIFGKDDPHNGYGPNSFYRLAKKNKDIKIFGKGEELRDHISIKDITDIIIRIIKLKKKGEFNLVTGKVQSFENIAKKLIKLTNSKSKIINLKRTSPMPHNGYRAFDNSKLKKIHKTKFHGIETLIDNEI